MDEKDREIQELRRQVESLKAEEPGVCYIVAWLPKGENYHHSHFYEIAEYTGEGWNQTDFPFARKGAEVIAWMELPEMYKEEE